MAFHLVVLLADGCGTKSSPSGVTSASELSLYTVGPSPARKGRTLVMLGVAGGGDADHHVAIGAAVAIPTKRRVDTPAAHPLEESMYICQCRRDDCEAYFSLPSKPVASTKKCISSHAFYDIRLIVLLLVLPTSIVQLGDRVSQCRPCNCKL
jgi:hypothetical protein